MVYGSIYQGFRNNFSVCTCGWLICWPLADACSQMERSFLALSSSYFLPVFSGWLHLCGKIFMREDWHTKRWFGPGQILILQKNVLQKHRDLVYVLRCVRWWGLEALGGTESNWNLPGLLIPHNEQTGSPRPRSQLHTQLGSQGWALEKCLSSSHDPC
jgi:hypothetical protein